MCQPRIHVGWQSSRRHAPIFLILQFLAAYLNFDGYSLLSFQSSWAKLGELMTMIVNQISQFRNKKY